MYACEMFNHQQRTHIFQLLVFGQYARFIFMDHSGAIVSERVDYTTCPGDLGEFFWRMNYMTDKARGVDSTSSRAVNDEKELFTSTVKELLNHMKDPLHKQRMIPDAELTLDAKYPVYRMSVREDQVETKEGGRGRKEAEVTVATMELLVQRPIFDSVSPLGRSTRGYIAGPVSSKEPLFLKDTWRADQALLKAESEIYRLLEKYGVPRVPRLICGGDVKEGTGSTQRTICAVWAKRVQNELHLDIVFNPIRDHTHARLVQRLAYPIETATNSKELTQAFDDALMIEAVAKAPGKLLHRDISAGNVMLGDKDGDHIGLLADWDHATETESVDGYKHQLFRTGTWPFMSIALLRDPEKPHDILDDLEAHFWTFVYAALHRFKHSGNFNADFFNDWNKEANAEGQPTGQIVGGGSKLAALDDIGRGTLMFKCAPLRVLIISLAKTFRKYYIAVGNVGYAKTALLETPQSESAKEEYAAECRVLDDLRGRLSNPSYWRNFYKEALGCGTWVDDVSTTVMHPARTEAKGMELFGMHTRTSYQASRKVDSDHIASRDKLEEKGRGERVAPVATHGGSEDMDFPLIPEADKDIRKTDHGPSPPLSPTHQPNTPSHHRSGSNASQSDDDVLSSPSIMAANSRKRTLEGFEGTQLSKRPRSIPDMPPPTLIPLSRAGPAASRRSNSRTHRSGDFSAGVAGPSGHRYGLRSRDKGKEAGGVRSMDA
ncbi:hypothetical protein BDY19DRAFT_1010668 [Irpex rosettiformis]|uniref:Uncharacterized protein n=1 Tax=Irpex rosettiformis TaxID=378272 RepID=A0ACB8U0K5_9APHY|nr:hypothetical protein BDY19DRAFT_1010668 [Irpex rosettiformis]